MLLNIDGENDPAVHEAIGKYGLGTTRSFEQYQEFVGCNTAKMELTTNRCGTHKMMDAVTNLLPFILRFGSLSHASRDSMHLGPQV